MKIIPAIDILEGKVVRLLKGVYQYKKEYSDDPVAIAKHWQDQGATYLHIVDLDGAKIGEPQNTKIIENIIKNITIPAEVGGGIRTAAHFQTYVDLGVDRIVLGTAVMQDIAFLYQREIKVKLDKTVVSFDARKEGEDLLMAGTAGWHREVPILDYRSMIDRIIASKIKYLNYTDRLKDGTLSGLSEKDMASFDSFLNHIDDKAIEITYAGGIASLEDIKRIVALKRKKLTGVIVGKALYEGKFVLGEAQREFGNA